MSQIWGKADTILFIFAGASAEFALNKSVDWLYFTGRLPSDPLGRLFSTVTYARRILFSDYDGALHAIDQITAIHKNVETGRGMKIPDEAYLDVLSLLIDYSIRSYELLERKLSDAEKEEVFEVFYRVGKRMELVDLAKSYDHWLIKREAQLTTGLYCSDFTVDLYRQYRKHLGFIRYFVLIQAQLLLVPKPVKKLLGLGSVRWLSPVLIIYKLFRLVNLQNILKNAILPPAYVAQVQAMDGIT
ncbi:oxygenase MpaB family protein [Mucilaginibacter sp. BT774]|uniref:oxygenase MpaB family protein n=1 Tax=Mucilaginibacter sp. BT774 TaxID=3062276 RepID=UPI00267578A3|nr:oxygenase MpaB family protein [Mucilaginibacter sp. BT774]